MNTMRTDTLRVAAELAERGRPFVLATVVRAVAPTSTKAGDKAVITEDGEVHGWVGGSCAEPIVKKEAQAALADGECRLLHISPEAELPESRDGLTFRPMTCYSGGLLEIHLEPNLARPALLVCGNSPVARALVELGRAMRYVVVVADRTTRPPMDTQVEVVEELAGLRTWAGPNAYVVVATHGTFDVDALETVLGFECAYVGLVASQRRRASTFDRLSQRGVSDEQLMRIEAPAGLDLGAREPEEVALTILARIVQIRRARASAEAPVAAVEATPAQEPHEEATTGASAPKKKGSCCHKDG